LQDSPQKFSYIQSWHIANPHLQVQQNGAVLPQQSQTRFFVLRRLRRASVRENRPAFFFFSAVSGMLYVPWVIYPVSRAAFDRHLSGGV